MMVFPIDHLVLGVHDLDAAASFYQRLGFKVGAVNDHPWGTQNRIIQLHGSFLELIALGPDFARKSDGVYFAARLKQYLARRQGFAMLALSTSDALAAQQQYVAAAVSAQPLFAFGRTGRRPNGESVELGFKLAFAQSPLLEDAGFFACQMTHPEFFWAPEWQQHDNSVHAVQAVIMVAPDPSDHAEFLTHFTGQHEMLASSIGLELQLGAGRLEVLTPLGFQFKTGTRPERDVPHFAAIRLSTPELGALAQRLHEQGIVFAQAPDRITISGDQAFGATLVFEPLPQ
ncbi:MAG: VOC family protein [Hyphomicrobiales bacterium]|nr:VOC family protein [Hyphomicrobiales bacterium]MDE2114229.1 VOC family protein [Hyphomicrobiales bacterium]